MRGTPVFGVTRLPLDRFFNRVFKRVFDIVGATIGLLVSAPIIAVMGALVYLESPGPIIYRQRRLGFDGSVFEMLKIRSMRLDAESNGEVGWTRKGDPRRLRVGAFMRQWNIDELPQFWNVLLGNMSLVGPRPPVPYEYKAYELWHRRRVLEIKPGITGLWQVEGRSRIRFDATGTAGTGHDIPVRNSALSGAPQHQTGHHWMGADQRVSRRYRSRRKNQLRSLLPRELELAARSANPCQNAVRANERVLKWRLARKELWEFSREHLAKVRHENIRPKPVRIFGAAPRVKT